MRTLIQGGTIVAYNGHGHHLIPDGVVVFEDAVITTVAASYHGPVDRRIDARGMLVCPGFINTHVHVGIEVMTALLDVDRSGPGRWLSPSLRSVLQPREAVLSKEEQRVSAEYALARLLCSGCTTIVDVVGSGTLWWLGNPPDDIESMVDTVGRLGLRAYLSPGYRSSALYADATGRAGEHQLERDGLAGLEVAVRFIERFGHAHEDRVRGMLYPHATFNCSPQLLRETRRAADELGVGIQVHTASRLSEIEMLRERYGLSPIELLADTGCLGPDVILGHCVFIRGHSAVGGDPSADLPLIARAGSAVAHSPRPFARQGVALESFQRYLDAGVTMTMGTDIWPLDMIAEMQLASLLGKVADHDPIVASAADIFTAATLGGARALGREDLGRLSQGASADILLIDVDNSPRIGPVSDPIKGLIGAGTADDVRGVIVAGRTLVEDGRVTGVDEGQLRRDAQGVGARLRKAVASRSWSARTEAELFPPAFDPVH